MDTIERKLFEACRNAEQTDEVRRLMSETDLVNGWHDPEGLGTSYQPLMVAVRCLCYATVRLLLADPRVEIDADDCAETSFACDAVKTGDLPMLKLVLLSNDRLVDASAVNKRRCAGP